MCHDTLSLSIAYSLDRVTPQCIMNDACMGHLHRRLRIFPGLVAFVTGVRAECCH